MKKYFINVLLIFGSVAVSLGLMETVLAVFLPHKILLRTYHEQYHPTLGWVNKPNIAGNFYHRDRSVFFYRSHNGHGLRSLREIPYEKPAGVKRVLLVGDSYFWGYGVDDRNVFSEVLQRSMGPSVEIINGAVTGYGTDQDLLWLMEEGVKYRPDIVILGCFPRNDMDEISHSVMYGGYPKPFFSLDGNRLVLHNVPVPDTRETRRKAFEVPGSFFGKVKQFLRHHTHTYSFLAERINALPGVRNLLLRAGLADEYTKALPGVPNVTLEPEKVLPLFKALIVKAQTVSREAGADFLLVFIPEEEQTPGAPRIYEGDHEGAAGRNTSFSEGLARFTAREKIKFLDLLPRIRERQARGEALYMPQSSDHHWTPAGHRLVAAAVEEWLKRN